MARALACFFWFLAIATAAAFILHPVWLPEVISLHGVDLDRQINLTFWIAGAAFFLAQLLIGYCLWRFGPWVPGPARLLRDSPRMEILWTAVTAIIFVGLGIQGQRYMGSHLPH